MTEQNDIYDGVVMVNEITFRGSGLTPGERLILVDGNGADIATYVVVTPTENGALVTERQTVRGIKVKQIPNGSVAITVRFR
jgi:hypothetical protein